MRVMGRLEKAFAGSLVGFACLLLTGCASVAGLQDIQFSYHMRGRASEALRSSFTKDQRRTLSTDFQAGFKQGFYDVAMNRDCRLPPVAPPKYWSAHYQSCEGQSKVQQWFIGYQQGIAVAQSTGQIGSAEAPVSPYAPVLNMNGCGTCFSPNPCSNCNSAYGEGSLLEEAHMPSIHPTEEFPMLESSPSDQNLPHRSFEAVDPVDADPVGRGLIGGQARLKPVSFPKTTGLVGGHGNLIDQ